jgi:hypothetical protein
MMLSHSLRSAAEKVPNVIPDISESMPLEKVSKSPVLIPQPESNPENSKSNTDRFKHRIKRGFERWAYMQGTGTPAIVLSAALLKQTRGGST